MRRTRIGLLMVILLPAIGCVSFSFGTRVGSPEAVRHANHAPPAAPQKLGIPRGHLPPPGACRVWHRGQPPGHQPPPGNCSIVPGEVGPGDWLIYRPMENKEIVEVSSHDTVWIYEFSTGRLLHER